MIKTVSEIAMERAAECVGEVRERYKSSIGIVYACGADKKVVAAGSCIFLRVDKRKYVVTAAHVVDLAGEHELIISGSEKTVRVVGHFQTTVKPDGSRLKDKFDFAFQELSDGFVGELGSYVTFIEADSISLNRGKMDGRQYLVLGFPSSKNKGYSAINQPARKVAPKMWAYQGTCRDALSEELIHLELDPEAHILVNFGEHSWDFEGGRRSDSIAPHGVSGGALIDLGRPHPDNLASRTPCVGRLAGVMIEVHKDEKIMAAVRIEWIIQAIRAVAGL